MHVNMIQYRVMAVDLKVFIILTRGKKWRKKVPIAPFKYNEGDIINTKTGSLQITSLYAMLKRAKELVVNYFNDHVEVTDNKKITEDDVFVVWFCKTLQNWKALVSTTVSDGMYYEVTHNGDKGDLYKGRKMVY